MGGEVAAQFWCDWGTAAAGHARGAQFIVAAALTGRRSSARNCRPLIPSPVISKQCPWSLSSFASQKSIDHVMRAAGGRGICAETEAA
eukprot:8122029-Pyramimonas_sp.AAC.1